jgi:hypothetical protein
VTAQIVNTTGLSLSIIGVVLIFIWGPPQPELSQGAGIGLEDNTPLSSGLTVAQDNARKARLTLRHEILSRAGLGLILVGFILQLWATWLPYVYFALPIAITLQTVDPTVLPNALITIASVSAVLWTGGLIVLQLRQVLPPALHVGPTLDQRADAIKGAMACFAFGALASTFALFETPQQFKVTAWIFFALYFILTVRNLRDIYRALRDVRRQWYSVLIAISFFAPTVAILIAAIFPGQLTVVWSGALLNFWGYFMLSDTVNVLGRRVS